jgi:hypothetical protein
MRSHSFDFRPTFQKPLDKVVMGLRSMVRSSAPSLKGKRLPVDLQEFRDGEEAAQAYARMEAEHRGDDDVEIVLVGADSIETIRLTHGQYFEEGAPTAATPFLLSN